MIKHMLTTVDNPYDPFTQWDEWFAYDERSGHHSSSILGRIAMVDDDLSEELIEEALEHAIDDIVHENFNGLFMKVSKEI
jgi:hypothetical protein